MGDSNNRFQLSAEVIHQRLNKGQTIRGAIIDLLHIGNVQLSDSIYKVTFENCEIKNFEVSFKGMLQIVFKGCSIETIGMSECEITDLVFHNSHIKYLDGYEPRLNSIKLRSRSRIEYLNLEKLNCNTIELVTAAKIEHLFLQSATIESAFVAHRIEESKFYFLECDIKKIEISAGSMGEQLTFDNGSIDTMVVSQSAIAQLSAKQIDIKSLTVANYALDQGTKWAFNQINFEKVLIDNFQNGGELNFNSTYVSDELTFRNAQLGQAVFNAARWSKCKIHFANSDISECRFIMIAWPTDHVITEPGKVNGRTEASFLSIGDAYRQLKGINLRQNNHFDAARFRYNELRIYYELLR